jgi:polar amino acid transport system substrate-binding protein
MKTMRKLFAALLVCAMACGMLAGCSKESDSDTQTILDKGELIVGITDFAPMDYKDESGNWTGFDAELAEMVGKELGVKVTFMEIDWDSKIMELNAGTIDCVWNGMTLTDEVLKSMECTEPYVLNAQVVVMKADAAAAYSDAESMKGLTFAVEAGSAGATAAADSGFEAITEVSAQSNALMEVAAGTSDACVIDKTMAEAMIGDGTSYPDLVAVLELTNEEYGIGFRKGSDMAEKVNSLLDKYRQDGSLQALADKYGLSLAD